MYKWSDYCRDECAHCGKHMGYYADTYEFNHHFITCNHCGNFNQSGYVDGVFKWIKFQAEVILKGAYGKSEASKS